MLDPRSLETRIQESMRAAHVPGLALAVVRDDAVIYAHGFGVTSIEDGGLQVTPDTLFRIGSVTKPLTGAAIMRLVEANQLDLDRPLNAYIPWLRFSAPDAAQRITLRMLLSHTAGLPTAAEHFGARDPAGLEAHVREDIPRLPFVAPPGMLYSYSNPGLNLAGYIAQTVAGRPFADLVRDTVFEPLDMDRTTFDPTVAMTYPLAQSHDLSLDGVLRVQHRFADNVAHYPSGFVMSTVVDLAHFAIMLLNQGRFRDRRVLAAESVAAMQMPHVSLYTNDNRHYGLTLGVETYKDVRLVRHNGGISTFGSIFTLVPHARVGVVMLFNRNPPQFPADQLLHGLLDELLDLPAEVPSPATSVPDRSLWPRLTGSYVGNYAGLAMIAEADNQLMLTLNGTSIPLSPLRQDLYVGRQPDSDNPVSVGFLADPSGYTRFIMVDGAPAERFALDPAYVPDPARLATFIGAYGGVDRLYVTLKDGSLYLASTFTGTRMSCIPLEPGRFACAYGLLEFETSDNRPSPALRVARAVTHPRLP